MGSRIGIGLLGLGTVGGGVASILFSPQERHPLVSDLEVARVAVRDLNRARTIDLPADRLTTDPHEVVRDPAVDVVVEVIGGIEPARTLILEAIAAGKSVVTANKAVIARHGQEIAEAAASAGVYVLIEAAVGGGIPIIEPLKQSLGGNRIDRVSGIINGTTNYILTRMADEGAAYDDVLAEAQKLGYAEADPAADVDGLDAADKIAILSTLAFGGAVERSDVPTQGISQLQGRDVDYARQLGYGVKLLAVAERMANEVQTSRSLPLSLRVQPTLVPTDHPLFGVNGVNIGLFCSTPMVALTRSIPRKQALEMLTTGEFISAPRAAELGLINRAVPDDQLATETNDMIRETGNAIDALREELKRLRVRTHAAAHHHALRAASEARPARRAVRAALVPVERLDRQRVALRLSKRLELLAVFLAERGLAPLQRKHLR